MYNESLSYTNQHIKIIQRYLGIEETPRVTFELRSTRFNMISGLCLHTIILIPIKDANPM